MRIPKAKLSMVRTGQRGRRWPFWCKRTTESRTSGVGRAEDACGRGTALGGS
ncbi:hypothetical protein CXB51_017407 [Gossypium anomalum]|uniref:Uncharacterized protein n=1 Tax=Gossypium anomalum TaxID=47600 RepID=A0A8J5YNG3_9ROSI|nr:hypothetical protein CXB51_017407 [Gossypium anomalum]